MTPPAGPLTGLPAVAGRGGQALPLYRMHPTLPEHTRDIRDMSGLRRSGGVHRSPPASLCACTSQTRQRRWGGRSTPVTSSAWWPERTCNRMIAPQHGGDAVDIAASLAISPAEAYAAITLNVNPRRCRPALCTCLSLSHITMQALDRTCHLHDTIGPRRHLPMITWRPTRSTCG